MNSFYSKEEIKMIGLNRFGDDVQISRFARFYSPEKISIGSNVRIDDFCILSGEITIGSNVHISAYVGLYGAKGIIINDYSGISPMCTLFSAMDDFNGDYLIGPIHSKKLTNVTGGNIILEKFTQIGANCVVFPNLTIGEGSIIGASSLVNQSLDEWGVYAGIPVEWKKKRNKGVKNII